MTEDVGDEGLMPVGSPAEAGTPSRVSFDVTATPSDELPQDIIDRVLAVGRVEWGATAAKSDEEHLRDFANTLRITRDEFGTVGDVALHGVFVEGDETVLCHTGTSQNSAQHARILVGAWNQLFDLATSKTSAHGSLAPGSEATKPNENKDLSRGLGERERLNTWIDQEFSGLGVATGTVPAPYDLGPYMRMDDAKDAVLRAVAKFGTPPTAPSGGCQQCDEHEECCGNWNIYPNGERECCNRPNAVRVCTGSCSSAPPPTAPSEGEG
jgi:hypothetical protein